MREEKIVRIWIRGKRLFRRSGEEIRGGDFQATDGEYEKADN
jgi:hypothetical protein